MQGKYDVDHTIVRYGDMTPRYKTEIVKPFMAMGAVQVSTGILSLMTGIANVLICGIMGIVGYGIWGGALFIITGALGIMSAHYRTRGCVAAHLALSIVSCCMAATQFCLGVSSAYSDDQLHTKNHDMGCIWNYWGYNAVTPSGSAFKYYIPYVNYGWTQDSAAVNMPLGPGPAVTDALLASFAIIHGIVAIIAAIFGCRACCCATPVEPAQERGSYVHSNPAFPQGSS